MNTRDGPKADRFRVDEINRSHEGRSNRRTAAIRLVHPQIRFDRLAEAPRNGSHRLTQDNGSYNAQSMGYFPSFLDDGVHPVQRRQDSRSSRTEQIASTTASFAGRLSKPMTHSIRAGTATHSTTATRTAGVPSSGTTTKTKLLVATNVTHPRESPTSSFQE